MIWIEVISQKLISKLNSINLEQLQRKFSPNHCTGLKDLTGWTQTFSIIDLNKNYL